MFFSGRTFLFTSICAIVTVLFTVYAITLDESYFLDLGDTYHRTFNNQQALKEYKKAYEINPDNYETLRRLTLVSNDCGEDYKETNTEKAKDYFRMAVEYAELSKEKFPTKSENYLLLAVSYGNLARYTSGKDKVKIARDVEKNFRKMIENHPDFAPSYVGLGIYYREVANLSWILKTFANTFFGGLENGTLKDSEKMLLKAIELDPHTITPEYHIAVTYVDMQDYEKAKDHFLNVLRLPVTDHEDPKKKDEAREKLIELGSDS